MKRVTAFLLKLALFLIVIPILGFFIIVLPRVMTGLSEVFPVAGYVRYPGLVALYAAIIPFLFAIYQTIKLIIYIQKKQTFSELSAKVLKNLKYSSIIISVLYVIATPLLFLMGDKDDAPGIILFGFIVFLSFAVTAVFSSIFEKLCKYGKGIKA